MNEFMNSWCTKRDNCFEMVAHKSNCSVEKTFAENEREKVWDLM